MTGRLLLAVIAAYRRYVSPLLGPRCRFAPSCSAYAAQAIEEHGTARGSWLAARRLARCHPFHPGGHDPVPTAGPARRRPVSPPGATSATMDGRTDDVPASRPGPGG